MLTHWVRRALAASTLRAAILAGMLASGGATACTNELPDTRSDAGTPTPGDHARPGPASAPNDRGRDETRLDAAPEVGEREPASSPTSPGEVPAAGEDSPDFANGAAPVDDGGLGLPTPDGASGRAPEGPTDAASDEDWVLDVERPLSVDPPGLDQRTHSLSPTALWGANAQAPLPTNSFWVNLVLGEGEQRINLLPYHVKATDQGLSLSRPPVETTETTVFTADLTNVLLGAVEPLGTRRVASYQDLSITVTWGDGALESPLVYGMAYGTAFYEGLSPRLAFPGSDVVGVNGMTSGTHTSDRLLVELNNGQSWLVYSSEMLEWEVNDSELMAKRALSGWIRVALLSEGASASILDEYAKSIPIAGQVRLSTTGDTGHIEFEWQTDDGSTPLMMALPHQHPRLVESSLVEHEVASLRGRLRGVVGSRWRLDYALSPITWQAPKAPRADLTNDILAALEADADFTPIDTDPYFGGKQLAKAARLVLIARELSQDAVADALLDQLKPVVSAWLDGTNSTPLVYDSTWGGIVTAAGIADPAADFGQGYYNDHHFHYGYHIYAAAVLAREDPEWRSAYADKVLWLIRDIANPSRKDPYFPRFRTMDWFVGHSWAAGLFEFADNRNQESTSEAVNAWYAMELFGRATDNVDVTHLGRLLRAVETTSAQTYWQVKDSSIYPMPFSDHHAVGILWSTKVDLTTFFGADAAYVYGIQMCPFTPATEDLLSPSWIEAAQPDFQRAAGDAEEGWRGFMILAQGIAETDAAIEAARGLTAYDDGNSAANSLYWLATRP